MAKITLDDINKILDKLWAERGEPGNPQGGKDYTFPDGTSMSIYKSKDGGYGLLFSDDFHTKLKVMGMQEGPMIDYTEEQLTWIMSRLMKLI